MRVEMYRTGDLFVTMTRKEYDIFCQALFLMELAGLGVEKDTEKLRRLEEMKIASQNINIVK